MIAGIKHLIQFHHWPKWIELRRRSYRGGAFFMKVSRKCAVCSQEARHGR